MFKGYGQSYDANTAFAGAATNTPRRIGIWAPIERAKQLAICGLKFSLLMHWNAGEEAYLDPDEVRKPPKRIAWRNDLLYLYRNLQTR
jgi:hypothetical protein